MKLPVTLLLLMLLVAGTGGTESGAAAAAAAAAAAVTPSAPRRAAAAEPPAAAAAAAAVDSDAAADYNDYGADDGPGPDDYDDDAAAATPAASALLSAARRAPPPPPPYPAGECLQLAPLAPCPNQTCAPGACPARVYATASPARNATYAVRDFDAACDEQPGCLACALWNIAVRDCTAAERCERRRGRWGAVAAVPARERRAGDGLYCFTNNHWLVVPLRACTGVESRDPRCAGRRAERYWESAQRVALDKGFPAAGRAAPDGTGAWAVLLNPVNGRSQHQTHFRVARLVADYDAALIGRFVNATAFSDDARAPTLTASGVDDALFASVFVEARAPRQITTRVKPFQTAATVAAAARPGVPYGIMLTPHRQRRRALGPRPGRRPVPGFVVTAFFTIAGSRMLDESVGDSCATSPCSPWAP